MGLSSDEQGYYYTFASLLAIQVLFELGLGQVIIQIVGHEAAHLKFNKDGSVDGPVIHIGRMASILSLLRRWYFVAAVVFAVMEAL